MVSRDINEDSNGMKRKTKIELNFLHFIKWNQKKCTQLYESRAGDHRMHTNSLIQVGDIMSICCHLPSAKEEELKKKRSVVTAELTMTDAIMAAPAASSAAAASVVMVWTQSFFLQDQVPLTPNKMVPRQS